MPIVENKYRENKTQDSATASSFIYEAYPKLSGRIKKAKEAGFSEDDIRKSIGKRISKAREAGYSIEDINRKLGAINTPKEGSRYFDAMIEGGLSSIIGLTEAGQVSTFEPKSRKERLIFGGAKIFMDLPIYTLGGELAGPAGAFALPAALETQIRSNISGNSYFESLPKVALETVKGGILGYFMGAASVIGGPLKRFLTEIGVLTGVGSALEGKVPTLDEAIDAAMLVGGIKGFSSGIKLIGGITKESPKDIVKRIDDRSKNENISREKALKDEIAKAIGEEVRASVDSKGKIDADRIELPKERAAREKQSALDIRDATKKMRTEEFEATEAERVRIKDVIPVTDEEIPSLQIDVREEKVEVNPVTGEDVPPPKAVEKQHLIERIKTTKQKAKSKKLSKKIVESKLATDLDLTFAKKLSSQAKEVGLQAFQTFGEDIDAIKGTIESYGLSRYGNTGKKIVSDIFKEGGSVWEALWKLENTEPKSISPPVKVTNAISKEFGKKWGREFKKHFKEFVKDGDNVTEATEYAKEIVRGLAAKEKLERGVPEELVAPKKETSTLSPEEKLIDERELAAVDEAARLLNPENRRIIKKVKEHPASATPKDLKVLRELGGAKRAIELLNAETNRARKAGHLSGEGVEKGKSKKMELDNDELDFYSDEIEFYSGIPIPIGRITKAFKDIVKKVRAGSTAKSLKDQRDIVKGINVKYLNKNGFDVDLTYSTGKIHLQNKLPEPTHKFDKIPQAPKVVKADVVDGIPLSDNSVNSVLFDPPFMVTKPKNLKTMQSKGMERFSSFSSVDNAQEVWRKGISEAARVSKDIVVVKIQDTFSMVKPRGKIPATNLMIQYAENSGMRLVDAYSSSRPMFSHPKLDTVVNYLVFRKGDIGLDFQAGIPPIPVKKIINTYNYLKPFVESGSFKFREIAGDASRLLNETAIVPFWNKYIGGLSNGLYKDLEREPHEHTFIAREVMLRPFNDLPKESKDKVVKVLDRGDREGRVYSREELTDLSELEIKGYRAVRATLDYMENIVLKKYHKEFLSRNASSSQIANWAGMEEDVYKSLKKKKRDIVKQQAIDKETKRFIKRHHIEGYVPRYRFGRYVAKVTRGKDGQVIWNEGVDTPKEAQDIIDNFTNTGPGTKVIDTKYHFNDYRDMLAISNYLPAISKMLKEAGVKDKEVETALSLITQQYASGRLARRKGIEGYSKDFDTAIETYIQRFPKAMAKRFTADKFSKMIKNMPDEYKKYAKDLVDYKYDRVWKEGKLNRFARTSLYAYYLGVKPAFAALNYTQRVTMTAPWTIFQVAEMHKLSGIETNPLKYTKEGWKRIGDAQVSEMRLMADLTAEWAKRAVGKGKRFNEIINSREYLTDTEKKVLLRLYRQGDMKEMRQLEITGGRKALKYIDIFGFVSERSNRIHAALVGARIYSDYGLKGDALLEATDRFIHATQIMYDKANRPKISRGVMAPVAMFKSFFLNYINMSAKLYKGNKMAFANMVAVMLALGGTSSLFTDEIRETADFIMENTVGRTWPLIKRRVARRINDNKAAKVAVHGIPSLIGIDAGTSVGIGSVISTALTPLYRGAVRLSKDITRTDITTAEKWKFIVPRQGNNFYKFYKLVQHGTLTDKFGKPYVTRQEILSFPIEHRKDALEIFNKMPKEFSFIDKMEILLGFPDMKVNEYYKDMMALGSVKKMVNDDKNMMYRTMAQQLSKEDYDSFKETRQKFIDKGYVFNTNSIIYHLIDYRELKNSQEDNANRKSFQ